jgi:hypothetical protein
MKSCVLALIGTIVTEVVTGFRGSASSSSSAGAFQTVQGWLALLTVAAIGISWYLSSVRGAAGRPWTGDAKGDEPVVAHQRCHRRPGRRA